MAKSNIKIEDLPGVEDLSSEEQRMTKGGMAFGALEVMTESINSMDRDHGTEIKKPLSNAPSFAIGGLLPQKYGSANEFAPPKAGGGALPTKQSTSGGRKPSKSKPFTSKR
jgi:hypothetical protein